MNVEGKSKDAYGGIEIDFVETDFARSVTPATRD